MARKSFLDKFLTSAIKVVDKSIKQAKKESVRKEKERISLKYKPSNINKKYGNIPKASTKIEADNLNKNFIYNDISRWQQMDFVVGYTIHKSNNCDSNCLICAAGSGNYPKNFKWTGWHFGCKCFITSILPNEKETDMEIDAILSGKKFNKKSVNTVKSIPQKLIDYVELHPECKNSDWYLDNVQMFINKAKK